MLDFTFIDRMTTSWCFLTASCENSDVANRHIDSSAKYLKLVSRFDRNCPNWLHARTRRFGSVSLWIMRLMASNKTAFFAFECWTFFDFGGSCALFRIVSKHSFNLPRTPGSSENEKQNELTCLLQNVYHTCTLTQLNTDIVRHMTYVILWHWYWYLDNHIEEESHVLQNLQHGFF
jgi:hypothetical protein